MSNTFMPHILDVNDERVKEAIFSLLPFIGLDVDGDLLSINGISYWVNARANTVEVVDSTK